MPSPSRPVDGVPSAGPNDAADAPVLGRRDVYYLGHRLTQVLGVVLLSAAVTLNLPAVEAGFFFTLAGLAAAQVLLDAGVTTLLIAHLGRVAPHVRWDQGHLTGSAASLGRVAWLTRFAIGWAVVTAAVAAVVLAPLALWLLGGRAEIVTVPHWRTIAVASMVALGLHQLGAALPTVLEGLGRVATVARFRTGQDVLVYAAAIGCVFAGIGLWSVAALWGVRGLLGLLWSVPLHRRLAAALARPLRWRTRHARAMAPTQWRLAVSWTAGYLGQQTLVPLAYAMLGPVLAGRVGLGFMFTSGLVQLASAWVAARTPEMSRLAGQRRWLAFDALAAHTLRLALASAVAGGVLLGVGVLLLGQLWPALAPRLPALGWLVPLAAAAAVAVVVHAIATALRAGGEEPFMLPTLVIGLLCVPVLALGARLGGAAGLCAAYLVLSGGLGLPWAWWLRRRFHRERAR